jgi:hypothetical protein
VLASSQTSRYELRRARARSSAEEHYLDIDGVNGGFSSGWECYVARMWYAACNFSFRPLFGWNAGSLILIFGMGG